MAKTVSFLFLNEVLVPVSCIFAALLQGVKLRSQTFKSSYIKLLVLLLDIFYMLISRSILISSASNGDKAKASLGILIIIGLVYLLIATAYTFRNIIKKDNCAKGSCLVDIVHLIGGLVYFVGDNYPTLIRDYGTELGCGTECLNSVVASEPVLLGVAVVFYRVIPFCITKYYQSRLAKGKQDTEVAVQLEPEWVLGAESLTLLVEFDSWFTVVGMSPASRLSGNTTCLSDAYTGATWVFWVFFLLMYMFIVHYVLHIQYDFKLIKNINLIMSCLALNFSNAALWCSFGFYLLADNALPLRCTGTFKDDSHGENVARIVMLVIVMITVGTAAALLAVYRCLPRHRQEKLLPAAFYQRLLRNPDDVSEASDEKHSSELYHPFENKAGDHA